MSKVISICVGAGFDEEAKTHHVIVRDGMSTWTLNEAATRFLADQLLMTANYIWPVIDQEDAA